MTRIEAVRVAIEEMKKQRIKCSKDKIGIMPLEGQEERYYQLDDALRELEEICQALQEEGVKRSIAAWQEKIIEDPESIRTAMEDLRPAG